MRHAAPPGAEGADTSARDAWRRDAVAAARVARAAAEVLDAVALKLGPHDRGWTSRSSGRITPTTAVLASRHETPLGPLAPSLFRAGRAPSDA